MDIAEDASLPVRGAWVEISTIVQKQTSGKRRSPCGERGLKLLEEKAERDAARSLPVRGAWVEIGYGIQCVMLTGCRSPCGERGLKSKPAHPQPCP